MIFKCTKMQFFILENDPFSAVLPVKYFLDFKPEGGLCQILVAAYKFKTDHGWSHFKILSGKNKSNLDEVFEMFRSMEKALIENDLYKIPVVYINQNVGKAVVRKIKDIVRKRNGEVVVTDESSTHILFNLADAPVKKYRRPLIKSEKMQVVHWPYFPDSFNIWFNPELIGLDGGSVDIPSPRSGPWCVSYSWVFDLDQYNEWMSEEDYEINKAGRKVIYSRLMSVEDSMNPIERAS